MYRNKLCFAYFFCTTYTLTFQSDQVTSTYLARNLSVYCKEEATWQCKPGDHFVITKIYLPIFKTGYLVKGESSLVDDTFDTHVSLLLLCL